MAGFLIPVSGFSLMTLAQRTGLAAAFFLAASACFLPVALLRRTALERRIASLPGWLSLGVLAALLGLSLAAVANYWLSEPRLI